MVRRYIFSSLLLVSLFIALQANAFEDENSSESDLNHSDGVILKNNYSEQLPSSEKPLNSQEALSGWLTRNKAQLGFSKNSQIEVSLQGSSINDYQVYKLQQSINGVDVFGHQSTIVLKNGQAESAFIVSTDLDAPPAINSEDIASLLHIAEKKFSITIDKNNEVVSVYWKQDDKLVPAIVLHGNYLKGIEDFSATIIVDRNGNKLFEYSNIHTTAFRTTDFDRACARQGFRDLIPDAPLYKLLENTYNNRANWSSNRGSTKSSNERKLFDLMTNSNRFMSEVLGVRNISSKPRFGISAFVSSGWYKFQMNCGRYTNTNAYWEARNKVLAIHTPLLNNPEVVVHELGHGVVSESAGLIYRNQSGALNESFSDMLGVSFASWQAGRLDNPSRKDLQLRLGNTVIRDMARPASVYSKNVRQNLPDHYSLRYRGSKDKGGVHINSSITNHSFYLLAKGGTHRNGSKVKGIGYRKALKIWHYAVTNLMTQTSNFRDARYAVAKAAEIIYGEYGQERTSVHQSFDAVGIPGSWSIKVKPKQQPKKEEKKLENKKPKEEKKAKEKSETKTAPKTDVKKKVIRKPEEKKSNGRKDSSTSYAIYIALAVIVLIIIILIKRFKPKKPESYKYDTRAKHRNQQVTDENQNLFRNVVSGGNKDSRNKTNVIAPDVSLFANNRSFNIPSEKLVEKGAMIGRRIDCDIVLSHPSISSYHARLKFDGKRFLLEDIGSSYGTFVRNSKLSTQTPVAISVEESFLLSDLKCSLVSTVDKSKTIAPDPKTAPLSHSPKQLVEESRWCLVANDIEFDLPTERLGSGVIVGRSNHCDIIINHPSVSSSHAKISGNTEHLYIEDLGSTYGTFVDDSKISTGQKVKISSINSIKLSDLNCRLISKCASGKIGRIWLINEQYNFELDSFDESYFKFTIGRSSNNDLVVEHASVSGQHGLIESKNGQWFFTDLGSSYGSIIKRKVDLDEWIIDKVEKNVPIEINHGDTITLSDLDFRVFTRV